MAEPITEQQTQAVPREALQIPTTLKSLIETLIFAADEPLTIKQIKAIYERQEPGTEERHIEQAEVQQIIDTLNKEYRKAERGYRIIAIAGGFQFATFQEYAEWIGRLYKEQGRRKLSQSSLESLAIIAYKQPITKPEIESIRGVNCDYVLKTLLEKDLVTITGRADTVGRPLLYGTTREFLKHFGLNEVTDLPRPREIEEILGESQFETERRMLEAQAGADQTKKEEEEFKSRLPHIPKKKPVMDETVQIVPKKRSRNLTIRAKEEKEREQEQLEFRSGSAETDAPAGRTEKPSTAPIETKQTGVVDERSVEVPPAVEDVEPSTTEADEPRSDSVLANEGHSNDYKNAFPPQSETPAETPEEPELPQPRRSRWNTWKQKLKTFIRDLFG